MHYSLPSLSLSLFHIAIFLFFFFNDTATTEIYTLSLHDALPISSRIKLMAEMNIAERRLPQDGRIRVTRSEEHTSELQSRSDLVCRLLLEKKKKTYDEHEQTTEATQLQYPRPQSSQMRLFLIYPS